MSNTANAISETKSFLLIITDVNESVLVNETYASAKEAISAARKIGGFYTIHDTSTGKLVEAQW